MLDIAAYSDAAVIQNTYLDTLLGPHGGNLSWSALALAVAIVFRQQDRVGFSAGRRYRSRHSECSGYTRNLADGPTGMPMVARFREEWQPQRVA